MNHCENINIYNKSPDFFYENEIFFPLKIMHLKIDISSTMPHFTKNTLLGMLKDYFSFGFRLNMLLGIAPPPPPQKDLKN